MGIYNRDYLRDDEGYDADRPSGAQRNATSIVVKLIIATALRSSRWQYQGGVAAQFDCRVDRCVHAGCA